MNIENFTCEYLLKEKYLDHENSRYCLPVAIPFVTQ